MVRLFLRVLLSVLCYSKTFVTRVAAPPIYNPKLFLRGFVGFFIGRFLYRVLYYSIYKLFSIN